MPRSVRARIRRDLPADVFRPRPWRALLLPAWALVATALGVAILLAGLPWWADVGLALLLGHTFGVMGFSAHEILHDATVRSRRLQDLLGWVGMAPFLISPHLWREWHNRQHHAHANQNRKDPDHFGPVHLYEDGGPRQVMRGLLPGSGTLVSYAFLAYWFTLHGLTVLLRFSRKWGHYDRRPALAQTALQAAMWLGILGGGIALAGWEAVLVTVVPMMLGNALLMGYIATNHMMRPECELDEPVDNSMSVTVPAWLDVIHGWFSHHVEHHLFPTMACSSSPKVRAWLQDNTPERYVAPGWGKALWWLYRTPRPHDGPDVLADPARPARAIHLPTLTAQLRDDRFTRLAPESTDAPSPTSPSPTPGDAPATSEQGRAA